MKHEQSLSRLSEHELLDRFGDLVRRDRHHTAHLLATIAEIDERKLWAKHACPSMFAFCVERFHMSESVTAKRIWAARTARRFPVILRMVARGELTLSAIQLVSKHLTQENHRTVLVRARHKSTREIERLVAELAPKPDVPSRIRALPNTRRVHAVTGSEPAGVSDARGADAHGIEQGSVVDIEPGAAVGVPGESGSASDRAADASTAPPSLGRAATAERPEEKATGRSPRDGRLVPLSPRRYKLEVTVDQETHDKLRALQDLMSHGRANADAAAVVSKAIDRLLVETLKAKAAVCDGSQGRSPRSSKGNDKRRKRSIPAAVRRQVWRRDEGRCSFVDSEGRRCGATRAIEYHHETPYARGGKHQASNIALRCCAHNQYQADLDFGRTFMREKRRREVREDSARNVLRPAGDRPCQPFAAGSGPSASRDSATSVARRGG